MSLWQRLIIHARGCSITYRQKVHIRGERDRHGYWWYAAYLDDNTQVSGKYFFDGRY